MTEGAVTWMCAHGKTDLFGDKNHCGKPATVSRVGMDRCDEHEIDSVPCVWKANLNEENFCVINHETYGHIYGSTCRNPKPEK